MAKSLLNCVNKVLLRVNVIAGDQSAFTTLTDSARQGAIDIAVQVINEGIDELYTTADAALPKGQGESTITLATGTRAYALAADMVELRWPMIDKTNTQYLFESNYNTLLQTDPDQDDTGLPHHAAIRPTDGLLFLDRAPTSNENGRVYTYQYDKDLVLTDAADTVPFGDITFRSMVPAWVQLWKREKRGEFDGDLFRVSIGRAARTLPGRIPRTHYNPRG